jgi:hypothetical protein
MKITSATYAPDESGLVRLTFDDGTNFAVYPNDGSEDTYADVLLAEWLEAGNEIATPGS